MEMALDVYKRPYDPDRPVICIDESPKQLISEVKSPIRGYTMTQQNTSELFKSLSFEDHPLHVFLYDGNIAFLALQVADVLGIQNVSHGLRESKSLVEGVDLPFSG